MFQQFKEAFALIFLLVIFALVIVSRQELIKKANEMTELIDYAPNLFKDGVSD